MREIRVSEITEQISRMCIEVNHDLSDDMKKSLETAQKVEKSNIGQNILSQLQKNLKIAKEKMIPICQDTGMAVVFLEVGQEVHFVGGDIEEAVNEGVRRGYTDGYLRKSVVKDPIERENTGDNTPAGVHYRIIPGDKVKITLAPKGFGSENMSQVFMLKPAQGIEGVKASILKAVEDAGPNACPPMVVGVGIGGTFEKAALLAKQALTDPVGDDAVDKLERSVSQIGENSADVVCLYAPSRDIDEIREIDPNLWRSYEGFTDSIKDKKSVIYDTDHNAEQYIRFVSGYYGAAGSLAHKCRNMGKPVMLMSMV